MYCVFQIAVIGQNLTWGRVPQDIAKDATHKFVEWDGVVVASTGLPPGFEARGLEV